MPQTPILEFQDVRKHFGGVKAVDGLSFSIAPAEVHAIVGEKLKSGAPELLVQPNVGTFGMLDFFRTTPILRAAEPVKEEVKSRLGALLAL